VISVTSLVLAAVVFARAKHEHHLSDAYSVAESLVVQRTTALRDTNAKLEQELHHRLVVEEHLRVSEERYRLLFKRSLAGICLATPEGTLLECNDSFAQNLGYSTAEELRNVQMESIYFDRQDRATLVARLLEWGRLNNVELCCRRKDGTVAWLLSNLTVMESGDKGIVFQSSSVDITEIKRAHEELRHLSAKLMNSQDQERRRIARELHDSVGQSLVAIIMALQVAGQKERDLSGAVIKKLHEAAEAAKTCLAEVRTMSYLLHPPALEELGLAAAIRWYIDGFVSRSRIEVTAEISPEIDRLDSDIELTLFRVLQECLTNVHRHSKSQTATVSIHRTPIAIVLEVEDHGRTGVTVQSFRPGVGIMGMRERVRGLGGTLEITSRGFGTHVIVEIPLSSEAKAISAER
jgi:PAS domain S-box-containing protein